MYDEIDFNYAKKMLKENGYTYVAVKGEKCLTSEERGVKPLLDLLDKGMDLSGFCVADKVIGNGAAMLYVLLNPAVIYTPVISEAAKQTLETHNISIEFDLCVREIRNRTDTGICPMELAVQGIENPKEARKAIRSKLAEMNQMAKDSNK